MDYADIQTDNFPLHYNDGLHWLNLITRGTTPTLLLSGSGYVTGAVFTIWACTAGNLAGVAALCGDHYRQEGTTIGRSLHVQPYQAVDSVSTNCKNVVVAVGSTKADHP